MTTMTEPTTRTLEAPGATLTYDVRQTDSPAPVLVLIGSQMGAGGFATLASPLFPLLRRLRPVRDRADRLLATTGQGPDEAARACDRPPIPRATPAPAALRDGDGAAAGSTVLASTHRERISRAEIDMLLKADDSAGAPGEQPEGPR